MLEEILVKILTPKKSLIGEREECVSDSCELIAFHLLSLPLSKMESNTPGHANTAEGSNKSSNVEIHKDGNHTTPSGLQSPVSTSNKPSLGQQFLRSFRPRASVTAAPYLSSPSVSAIDASSAVSTPGLGPPPKGVLGASSLSTAVKDLDKLTLKDYQEILEQLRKPIPSTHADYENAIQKSLESSQIILQAIRSAMQKEQQQIETDQEDLSMMGNVGPPQADVIKTCLLLLTRARQGQLPMTLCQSTCELVTASVQLSDLRASKVTKAARETRSGAPGSQSSKAKDSDFPLANIDRAALFGLVCKLSDQQELREAPSKSNDYATQLPCLPAQIKAIECLSLEGRDVASFPGILEFLGQALEITWQELQLMRTTMQQSKDESPLLLQQLTLCEYTLLSCLQLTTSIVKYSFAKLDLTSVQDMLLRVSAMIYEPSAGSRKKQERRIASSSRTRIRSRSKDRTKPITEGYDYYGLEALDPAESTTPSPMATPRGAATPYSIQGSAPAPIALATVPPVSAIADLRASSQTDSLQLQETEVRAALKLVDSVLRFGFMPPNSVESSTLR